MSSLVTQRLNLIGSRRTHVLLLDSGGHVCTWTSHDRPFYKGDSYGSLGISMNDVCRSCGSEELKNTVFQLIFQCPDLAIMTRTFATSHSLTSLTVPSNIKITAILFLIPKWNTLWYQNRPKCLSLFSWRICSFTLANLILSIISKKLRQAAYTRFHWHELFTTNFIRHRQRNRWQTYLSQVCSAKGNYQTGS